MFRSEIYFVDQTILSYFCALQTHSRPHLQHTGQDRIANILTPDTSAHLQRSAGVHASTVQGHLCSKKGNQHNVRYAVVMYIALLVKTQRAPNSEF